MRNDVRGIKYRQAFSLSYAQLLEEPLEQIELAYLVWEKETLRDKLRAESQKQGS